MGPDSEDTKHVSGRGKSVFQAALSNPESMWIINPRMVPGIAVSFGTP